MKVVKSPIVYRNPIKRADIFVFIVYIRLVSISHIPFCIHISNEMLHVPLSWPGRKINMC